MDWRVPWLTSGWYGVYAVYHSPRSRSWSTAGGLQWRYTPAPRNDTRSVRLRPAISRNRAASSSSGSGAGRSRVVARRASGMSAKRSSTLSRPSAESIRSRSAVVWGPYGIVPSAGGDEVVVCPAVEQVVELGLVGYIDLDHPARTVWVAVDELGLGSQGTVRRRDVAAHGREQVADRLDRFDDAERLGDLQVAAGIRQLHEHDVAELV